MIGRISGEQLILKFDLIVDKPILKTVLSETTRYSNLTLRLSEMFFSGFFIALHRQHFVEKE